MLAQLRDGAMWACPAAGRVYRIDKANSKLVVVVALDTFPEDDKDKDEVHDRIRISFEHVGYAMMEEA